MKHSILLKTSISFNLDYQVPDNINNINAFIDFLSVESRDEFLRISLIKILSICDYFSNLKINFSTQDGTSIITLGFNVSGINITPELPANTNFNDAKICVCTSGNEDVLVLTNVLAEHNANITVAANNFINKINSDNFDLFIFDSQSISRTGYSTAELVAGRNIVTDLEKTIKK